jgi:hypothetical protein
MSVYFPAAHNGSVLQAFAFTVEEYLPALQSPHPLSDVLVGCTVVYFPAAHDDSVLQAFAFTVEEYSPALQSVHPLSDVVVGWLLTYFPATQLLQTQLV